MDRFLSNNNSGVGLVQVMIMMGVVASLSVAIMSRGKNAVKEGKTSEIRAQLRTELALVGDVLHSPTACQSFLQGQALVQSIPPAPTVVRQYNGTNPEVVPVTDTDANGNTFTVHNFTLGGEYFSYYILDKIMVEPHETNAELFFLSLEFHIIDQYEGKINMPSKFISRIRGRVQLDSGNIDECYTYSNQGVLSQGDEQNTIQEDELLDILCLGTGAIQNTGDNTCDIPGIPTYGCDPATPYLMRYMVDPDTLAKYPVCSAFPTGEPWGSSQDTTEYYAQNETNFQCEENEIQTGIDARGWAICEEVPVCGPLGSLRLIQGKLDCVQIEVSQDKIQVNMGDSCGITQVGNEIKFTCN